LSKSNPWKKKLLQNVIGEAKTTDTERCKRNMAANARPDVSGK
jgi:hypothetical protein